jgi:hypothetical protein
MSQGMSAGCERAQDFIPKYENSIELKSDIVHSIYLWDDGEHSQGCWYGGVSILIPFTIGYCLSRHCLEVPL